LSRPTLEPGIFVLDQGLAGPLTGLDAALRLKEFAPHAKITLSTPTPTPSASPPLQLSRLSTRACSRPTQHRSCRWFND
jgi:hypothetical protein